MLQKVDCFSVGKSLSQRESDFGKKNTTIYNNLITFYTLLLRKKLHVYTKHENKNNVTLYTTHGSYPNFNSNQLLHYKKIYYNFRNNLEESDSFRRL